MNNPLFVGIDVSKKDNHVQFLNAIGEKLNRFKVDNNQTGVSILVDNIKKVFSNTDANSVIIGLESTSIYGDHLAASLRQDEFLSHIDGSVHVLNAKQVAKFKESYADLQKNDTVDAFVIADYLRFGRISNEVHMDEKYITLRNLTRARFQAAQNLTREKTRFVETLFYKFSDLQSSEVFSDTFGATSLAVITEFFSVDDIAYMDLQELADFINNKGKGKFTDSTAIAKELQAVARSSYRLSKTVNESVNQLLAIRLIGIKAIQNQIKELDKAIENYMQLFPNTLISVKGIGSVYCAGIIAEIGDIKRFSSQAARAKFSGLAWTEYQSGGFKAANTRMINSGNKYLKYYLLEATNKVRMHDAEFNRFYQLKFKEVPNHQHKRALALTARKLVRLVYCLLSTNRLYTPPTQM